MEHLPEQIPSHENETMSLSELLDEARRYALPLERLEKIKDEQDSLSRGFLAGDLTLREYNSKSQALDTYPGVLQTEFITTFRELLMGLALSGEELDDILAHENAHMVEVLRESLEGIYRLEFARTEPGRLSFYPAISVMFPDDMDEDLARSKLRSMISAPDDLSDRDKSQLGNF